MIGPQVSVPGTPATSNRNVAGKLKLGHQDFYWIAAALVHYRILVGEWPRCSTQLHWLNALLHWSSVPQLLCTGNFGMAAAWQACNRDVQERPEFPRIALARKNASARANMTHGRVTAELTCFLCFSAVVPHPFSVAAQLPNNWANSMPGAAAAACLRCLRIPLVIWVDLQSCMRGRTSRLQLLPLLNCRDASMFYVDWNCT